MKTKLEIERSIYGLKESKKIILIAAGGFFLTMVIMGLIFDVFFTYFYPHQPLKMFFIDGFGGWLLLISLSGTISIVLTFGSLYLLILLRIYFLNKKLKN